MRDWSEPCSSPIPPRAACFPRLKWQDGGVPKPFQITIAVLILGILGWLGWEAMREPREPSYQGKRLNEWLAELDKEMPASNISWTNGPAATAIQQIGTNAIPYLRWRLKATDSRLKTALIKFSSQHKWLRVHLSLADNLRRSAASAAFCLGSSGSPLMPDMMGMLRSTNYAEAFTIADTMGRMGYCNPETIPTLLAALNEPPNASPGLHERAALLFLNLSQGMEIVIVDHPGQFHELGYKATVPALLKTLNAPKDMPLCLGATLKQCCSTILKAIDPEAAARDGVQ